MLPVVMWFSLVAAPPVHPEPAAVVRLDRSRHEVVVTAGPFDVHAMPPGMTHEDMEMSDDHSTPLIRFEWPVEGWLRGFPIEILDANGKPIDPRLQHHPIAINFDATQPFYSSSGRIYGACHEPEGAYLPKAYG